MTDGRRSRGRRALLLAVVLALLLAAGVVVGVLVTGDEEAVPPPPTETTEPEPTEPEPTEPPPTEPPPTEPPPPPAAGPDPVDVSVQATPVSARVTWRTGDATTAQVLVGSPELGPARWLPWTPSATSHEVTVGALQPRRTFRLWIRTRTADGGQGETSVDVTTPAVGEPIGATVEGGVLRLGGQPWFPLMVFGLCSHHIDTALAVGVTLLTSNPCGGLEEQLRALDRRALSAGAAGEQPLDDPTVVAWFYPDEADGQGMTGDSLPALPGGPTFLTLTNHFYSGADPLPQGRDMYPGLVARADVVGFDLYPLQEWCQRGRLIDVELAQRELVQLAPGKPTFQWIETAGMKCRETPGQEITQETVRAESWLAMIGGAVGLGFFPAAWTAELEPAIRRVVDETAVLAPALLGGRLPATVDGPRTVRAGAWSDGRTTVVAVVNAARAPATARVTVAGLGDRELTVLGELRSVAAEAGALPVSLAPLGTHVFVLPPPDA